MVYYVSRGGWVKIKYTSEKACMVHREIRYLIIFMHWLEIKEIRRNTQLVPEIPLLFRLTYLKVGIFIKAKRRDWTSLYFSFYNYYCSWATNFFQSIIRKKERPANFLYSVLWIMQEIGDKGKISISVPGFQIHISPWPLAIG